MFSDLYMLQTDGSLRRLTHGGIDSEPVWSSDGRQLAFQRTSKGGKAALYVANADGSGYRVLPDSVSGGIDWSPDNRRLLYVDDGRVYVTNEDWSARALLVDPKPGRAADAHWSPDGKQIVFALGDDTSGDVYVMNIDGTGGGVSPGCRAAQASPTRRSGRPTDAGSRTCCRGASTSSTPTARRTGC